MQYINFVTSEDGDEVPYAAPVPDSDAAYLDRISAVLRPLSAEQYMNGPAVILHSLAKCSYVLDNQDLFWCIEWQPGFVVIRFSPDGSMAWAAVRSPVPNFGAREAVEADWNGYDEHAPNPQYNLVLDPWDAQFDSQERERKGFVLADADVQARFQNALRRVNELCDILEQQFANQWETWRQRSMENLEDWCGEGLRLE